MQAPLQIAFHNLECPDETRTLIEEKVAWLERFHGRITSCRVAIDQPHRHHRQGNNYVVRIGLMVPGGEVVVNREVPQTAQGGNVEAAIRDAFEIARRLLEERTGRNHR